MDRREEQGWRKVNKRKRNNGGGGGEGKDLLFN